jgi:hypothetical protein
MKRMEVKGEDFYYDKIILFSYLLIVGSSTSAAFTTVVLLVPNVFCRYHRLRSDICIAIPQFL